MTIENIEIGRGRGMPLPSDMNDNGVREVVDDLGSLWQGIFKKNINLDRAKTAELINDFYKRLDDETCQWLEEKDPQYGKPRGILVKERAMQTAQIQNTSPSKRHYRGKKRSHKR